MSPTKRPGRPPANPIEGAAKNYTIRLTPAQQQRALMYGATVSQGINNVLRTVSGYLPAEVRRGLDK